MNKMIVAALAGVALVVTACVTTGEIEGHNIRGTAAETDPVEEAAREFWADVGESVANAYGTTPEEQKRGIYSRDPQIQAAMERMLDERRSSPPPRNDQHRDAPQWFRDGWNDYLSQAGGNFAVLAVDKNARGWATVRCVGGGCSGPLTAGGRSYRDVNYEHKALNLCRQNVLDNYPAHKPDCAIYAIQDKIVWKGPMPWK